MKTSLAQAKWAASWFVPATVGRATLSFLSGLFSCMAIASAGAACARPSRVGLMHELRCCLSCRRAAAAAPGSFHVTHVAGCSVPYVYVSLYMCRSHEKRCTHVMVSNKGNKFDVGGGEQFAELGKLGASCRDIRCAQS